jgi:hypothetical protein
MISTRNHFDMKPRNSRPIFEVKSLARRLIVFASVLLIANAVALNRARADFDFELSFTNPVFTYEDAGSFEVILRDVRSLADPDLRISSFQFDVTVQSGTGVSFSDASTDTTEHPYILLGLGQASSPDPAIANSFVFVTSTLPGDEVVAGDSAFNPPGYARLVSGDVVSLGKILFVIDHSTNAPSAALTFQLDGQTVFGDEKNNELPNFVTQNSSISLHSVPEPASLLLVVLGLASRWMRKRHGPLWHSTTKIL